jgi:hypothetical protein
VQAGGRGQLPVLAPDPARVLWRTPASALNPPGPAAADPRNARTTGQGTALVLADWVLVVRREAEQAYPATRKARVTFTGTGYQDGYRKGRTADIGGTRIGRPGAPALGSSRR